MVIVCLRRTGRMPSECHFSSSELVTLLAADELIIEAEKAK